MSGRIDHVFRYDISREWSASLRIEDWNDLAGGISRVREVAAALGVGRHVLLQRDGRLGDLRELLRDEEEEPMLIGVPLSRNVNRSTEAIARDHVSIERALNPLTVIEERIRVETFMAVVPIARAMEIAAAGFRDHVDAAARLASVFSLVAIGQHAHLGDRIHIR